MMADKNHSAASGSEGKQDPNKAADEVVNNLKSQGLFDQFRKECLEELEHLEAYRMLKQRVENHVASFLSKYKWSEKMSKNNVRDNLRMNINRSENLLNGIDRLIDQILATKSDSLSEQIATEIDKYLGIGQVEELAPRTEPSVGEAMPVTTTIATISNLSEIKSTKVPPPLKSAEASQSHSASPTPQGSAKSLSQVLPQATMKAPEKGENDQNFKKQYADNAVKTQRGSVPLNKGHTGSSQSSQALTVDISGNSKVQSLHNQNKKDSLILQGSSSEISKAKSNMENSVRNQKIGKDLEVSKLKRDAEKGTAKSEKNITCTNIVNVGDRPESTSHSENRRPEAHGNKPQPSSEMRPSNQIKAKNELPSSSKTEKALRIPVSRNSTEDKISIAKSEESAKANDCISGEKCDLMSDVANTSGTKDCGKKSDGVTDVEESNMVSTRGLNIPGSDTINQAKDKNIEDLSKKGQLPSNTDFAFVKGEQDGKESTDEELKVKPEVKLYDVSTVVDSRQEKEIEKGTRNADTLPSIDRDLTSNIIESVGAAKGNDIENEKENRESRLVKALSDEALGRNEMKGGDTANNTCKDPFVSEEPMDGLHSKNSENCSTSKDLTPEIIFNASDSCESEVKDIDSVTNEGSLKNIDELEKFTSSTGDSSPVDLQLGVGQRRVKRRRRLISEDEEKQRLKATKVDESESSQIAHDSKIETGVEDCKPKKARGRPRKLGGVKSDSRHSSDSEIPAEEAWADGQNRAESGRIKYRGQEEPIETRGVKRQRSVGSESNTSDTCVEDRDMESHRRTRRQIKPKRCYSPSDGK